MRVYTLEYVMHPVNAMIRAAIVDDEPLGRSRIRALLDSEGDIDVVAECGDARTAAALLPIKRPDLLVLDVQMPRGSAFSILERLAGGHPPATIFITARDEHAARAFDFNAVDYLLKPFDQDRFRESLARARRLIGRGGEPPEEQQTRFAVRAADRIYIVRIDEVDWIESAGNYVRLHVGPRAHLFRDSLMHFEQRLDLRRFVRIHRSTIVNVDRIAQLEPAFRREHVITLLDGTRLTLSAPYRKRLQALIGAF
jgi:two-component system LytT family response regulator